MATARDPVGPQAGQRAWSAGASGVVRSPSSVPITPVGTPAWAEDRPHQLGHRGLAVGPGHPDHGHGPGRMAVEGGGHRGHGRPDPARVDPHLGHVEVEEPLAQERAGPAGHGLGGVEVAVGVSAGDAAEQRTGTHLAAVEVDRGHLGRPRIAPDTEYVDVMDQLGHQHGREFQVVGREGWFRRFRSGPT